MVLASREPLARCQSGNVMALLALLRVVGQQGQEGQKV